MKTLESKTKQHVLPGRGDPVGVTTAVGTAVGCAQRGGGWVNVQRNL